MAELAAVAAAAASAASAIAPYAAIASTALTAAGTIASGNAARAQGQAMKQASEYEAKVMESQGKDAQATGQRQAEQYGRQKRLALSALTTRGAAGGFTATDPTALGLADEISRYGTFQEQMAQYGGETHRRDLEAGAAGRRYEGVVGDLLGKEKQNASYLSAAGTIAGGFTDLGTKYGGRRGVAPTSVGRYG